MPSSDECSVTESALHERLSRRDFVKKTAAGAAGLSAAGLMASGNFAYAAGSDTLRIGLIGCGGRGTGAANNCVKSSLGVTLWAMGDLFEDELEQSKRILKDVVDEAHMEVPRSRSFVGFDAYQEVLATDVDLVLLTTPPGFRPMMLRAAVEAGKHVFMEKPVAVDSAGIRTVIEASELAAQKGLAIVAGTQRRHDPEYIEAMERLHDGAIGDIVAAQTFYLAGGYRDARLRKPGMSDTEWQIRNWYYFTWLSGDHIVEQAVHRIDVQNWALQAHPVKATAVGGRQARVDPSFGHIFDHFGVDYAYPEGVRAVHMCSQIRGSARRQEELFEGTEGTARTSDQEVEIHGTYDWRYEGPTPNPYVQEHADLIASIRAGDPLNEGRRVAESVMTAILGREAAYTGQEITWEEIMQADFDLMPGLSSFKPLPVPPVPTPGVTTLDRSVGTRAAETSSR